MKCRSPRSLEALHFERNSRRFNLGQAFRNSNVKHLPDVSRFHTQGVVPDAISRYLKVEHGGGIAHGQAHRGESMGLLQFILDVSVLLHCDVRLADVVQVESKGSDVTGAIYVALRELKKAARMVRTGCN